METLEPNHARGPLSTTQLALEGHASEQDNLLRYRAGQRQGHVESLFLKGNSPDGQRAIWVKYTLLSPADNPEQAVAELWAIAFRRDSKRSLVANKQTFPLSAVSLGSAPFRFSIPGGELRHGVARGELGAASGPRLAWDFTYSCPAESFRPFPPRLYTLRFPRSKTVTPAPDSHLSGFFEVEGERWDLSGYRAAQGHNWGESHADAYAWAHGNAFDLTGSGAERVWFEALTGRVRVGPMRTPWLSCAALSIDGRLFRFDGPRAMLTRRVRIDARSYELELQQGDARLTGRFRLAPALTAGLRYQDPNGAQLSCLNSKLAYGEVVLTAQGRTWSFKTEQLALELGTRTTDHGITMLV